MDTTGSLPINYFMTPLSLQHLAQKNLKNVSFPNAKQEEFTYIPTQHLKPLSTISENQHFSSQENLEALSTKNCIILDNGLLYEKNNIPDNVAVSLSFPKDLLWEKYIHQLFNKENDWAALQVLKETPCISISIKKTIEEPLKIIYTHSQENKISQKFLLAFFLEENVTAHILVETKGHLLPINIVSNFFLKNNASAHYISNHHHPLSHLWFHKLNIWQMENSSFKGYSITKGGSLLARESVESFLLKENTHFYWNGLSYLSGTNQFHRYLKVHHLASHSFSDQCFRTILTDKAKSSVNGVISIIKGIHHVNGNQLIKNLMLSDECQCNNKPTLQIYSNDVKCSHGVTIGKIDENQLFYLQTRGYSKQEAEKSLAFAFLLEPIKKIEHSTIKKIILKVF